MMSSYNQQTFESIEPSALLTRVADLQKEGWRFVAISGARLSDAFELIYSFDFDYSLLNVRLVLPLDPLQVPSISSIYWPAVLYENELHDLFNLRVDGMAVDFKGNFYKTAVKYPFGSTKAPQATSTGTTTVSPSTRIPATTTTTATPRT